MPAREYVGLRISNDAQAVPTINDIGEGELAFNLASERIYARFGDQIRDITDSYTRAQLDQMLAGKAAAQHTHPLSDITDAGTAASADASDFDPSGTAASAAYNLRRYVDSRPDPLLMHFL